MYLRGETHLRLCTLSSPPSEKTSGGRKKYLIPPVCGGSNRHRLTAPKGRIPPCVFYKRPEKSLARCPQVRRLPCGFFYYTPVGTICQEYLAVFTLAHAPGFCLQSPTRQSGATAARCNESAPPKATKTSPMSPPRSKSETKFRFASGGEMGEVRGGSGRFGG